jgi:hypothetical protein
LNYFDEVKDPRIDLSKKHLLSDIIVISVLSFICGAETWNDIQDFGNANIDWLHEHLELNERVPSHDTFASCTPLNFANKVDILQQNI